MLNCHDATRLMSESQERKLKFREKLPLQLHLMMCSGCFNFNVQMGALRMMSREYAKGKNRQKKKPEL